MIDINMDYEKKYKEVLERAKRMFSEKELNYLFPELAESEDEKIRKAILNYFTKCWENCKDDVYGIHVEDAIAWLEKQGKKSNIFIWHNASEEPEEMQELLLEWESEDAAWHEVGFYHQNDKTYWDGERKIDNVTRWCYVEELLEKQGEQKPAWSEEDEKIALSIEQVMNCASFLNIVPDKIERIRTWLKSLKERLS